MQRIKMTEPVRPSDFKQKAEDALGCSEGSFACPATIGCCKGLYGAARALLGPSGDA